MEDRPVYSKSTCFETFPFPDESTGLTSELRQKIASLAEQIDAHRKRCLLEGLDDIGLSLQHTDEITAWEAAHGMPAEA